MVRSKDQLEMLGGLLSLHVHTWVGGRPENIPKGPSKYSGFGIHELASLNILCKEVEMMEKTERGHPKEELRGSEIDAGDSITPS